MNAGAMELAVDRPPGRMKSAPATSAREIAFRTVAARGEGAKRPGLVWLGGFKSDMTGTKAVAIEKFATAAGRANLRFDYSGHGELGGAFEDGTISRWLEESLAVFRAQTEGPQVLIGSSMGGWIALLLARALAQVGEESRSPAWC